MSRSYLRNNIEFQFLYQWSTFSLQEREWAGESLARFTLEKLTNHESRILKCDAPESQKLTYLFFCSCAKKSGKERVSRVNEIKKAKERLHIKGQRWKLSIIWNARVLYCRAVVTIIAWWSHWTFSYPEVSLLKILWHKVVKSRISVIYSSRIFQCHISRFTEKNQLL